MRAWVNGSRIGTDDDEERPGPRGWFSGPGGLLDRPLTSYYLVLGCSMLLLALGMVMVLSASSIRQYQYTGSAFTLFEKQALWVAIGLPLMWLAARMPPKVFRTLAYPLMLLSATALAVVLVPGLGQSVNGAQRWISFGGPFQLQPSEPAKLALILWGADLLARKEKLRQLTEWRQSADPAAARRRRPRHARHARQRPRHHAGAAHDLPGAAVGGRRAGPAVRRHGRS